MGRGVEPTSARKDERAARTPKQAARAALRCRVFVSAAMARVSLKNHSIILIVEPLPLLFFSSRCRFWRCSGLLTGGLCRRSAVLGGVRVAAATSSSARASNWRSRHAEWPL